MVLTSRLLATNPCIPRRSAIEAQSLPVHGQVGGQGSVLTAGDRVDHAPFVDLEALEAVAEPREMRGPLEVDGNCVEADVETSEDQHRENEERRVGHGIILIAEGKREESHTDGIPDYQGTEKRLRQEVGTRTVDVGLVLSHQDWQLARDHLETWE